MVRALTEVILPVILVAGLGAFLARKFTIDQTSTCLLYTSRCV